MLAFDVDWSRGRVVAIVDGSDEIAQASVVGGRLQTMEGFGERHAESDGRGATAVAIHPSDAVIATSGWHRRVRVWGLDPDMRNCRELGEAPQSAPALRSGYWGAAWSRCGRYLDTHNLALNRGERFDWHSGRLVGIRWGRPGPIIRHPGGELLAIAAGDMASRIHFALWEGSSPKWLPVAVDVFVPCRLAFGLGTMAVVGGTTRIHAALFDFPSLAPRFARKLELADEEVAAELGVSQAVALAPDGSVLYVPGPDGEIVALGADTGVERGRWRAHARMVTQIAHHPTRGELLSSSVDGTLTLSRVIDPDVSWNPEREVERLVLQYPPTLADPDRMGAAGFTIDTPW